MLLLDAYQLCGRWLLPFIWATGSRDLGGVAQSPLVPQAAAEGRALRMSMNG